MHTKCPSVGAIFSEKVEIGVRFRSASEVSLMKGDGEAFMPVGKKQLLRLIRLVAQLKENRYPNCSSFASDMRKADIDENLNVACTAKTVFRDIQTLKNDFDAPIAFDKIRNGYYLTKRDWNFSCPQNFEESEMLAAVLGARIAEHIFPEVMQKQIRNAVDCLLTRNNPDFLDKTQIDSLVILPENRTKIDADVFMNIFYAWQNHNSCSIEYLDSRGKKSVRDFEPHALIFLDGVWYTKGFCHVRKDMRTLVLARMTNVVVGEKTFKVDPAIVKATQEDNIFDQEMVENAVIHCDEYLTKLLSVKMLHPEQKVKVLPDGSSEISIKKISRLKLITWIMHQCGRAKLISPSIIASEIKLFAEKIVSGHK